MEEFAKKNPALDDGFHTALLERAGELETHPLVQEDADTSEFWVGGVASLRSLGNAKEAEAFFNAQRADPYLNGLLDGQMYGATVPSCRSPSSPAGSRTRSSWSLSGRA